MKKLVLMSIAAAIAAPLFAQEPAADAADARKAPLREVRKHESNVWPAFFAVCEYPAADDLVGIRLTIPFSTKQDNVTGLDLGFWGRCTYFEGIQLNIFRNDVKDDLSGFQVGLYNSIGSGDLFAIQAGLFNEGNSLRGIQAGLVNVAGEVEGFQVGLVNRAETLKGYQVGLINVIRDAEVQFCPVVNIGF